MSGPMSSTAVSNPHDQTQGGFQMPEKLQGKSAHEIAEMYVNLESMTGRQASRIQSLEERMDQYVPKADDSTPPVNPADKWNALLQKDHTTVTDEDLSQLGVPRELFDEYVSMKQERVNQQAQAEFDEAASWVGGQENLEKILNSEYVNNLSDDERAAINADLANPAKAKLILRGLAAEVGIQGTADKTQQQSTGVQLGAVPQRPAPPKVQAFASRAEYNAARKDPRYGKDPVYTRAVEERGLAYVKALRGEG